jgi:hypothetical protein
LEALKSLDDILKFVTDNSDDFAKERINSITDTIKEKKLEALLQSKVDKNIFDFSDINNYPIKAKDIVKLVYPDSDNNKSDPFEIAKFFDINIKIISNKSKDIAYLHYDLKDDSNIEIHYRDFTTKNLNAFLVGHELCHLFNHHLMGVFFENKTYNSNNHEPIEKLKKVLKIANNTQYATNYIRNKANFSSMVDDYEIEADIFSFNLLFYPEELSTKSDISRISIKLHEAIHRLNNDK